MVPRIHRRGNSFKGACNYVLHDPGKDSSERVAWVETQNIYSHPEDAWFEMFDTYRNRTALKKNAGVDSRGRDNKSPVLHYTLAWHAKDNPDPEHMKAMALDSLKALGLSEHEAVIACHSDKEHHHVHVVVNTVHPYTGKTAPLKFSKLEFSRWAEAYEKEHGIHCEQRIKNNERRREIAKQREAERAEAALALLTGKEPQEPAPFEAVNDNSANRRRWFERKDVVDKMKALRAALDQEQKAERGETWAGQQRERDDLDKKTHAALDQGRAATKDQYKDRWRDLYQTQKREGRQLGEIATHPLERAVFLFRNRARLGDRNKPLTIRQMIPLVLSGRKLKARVEQIHMRERRALARDEKTIAKQRTEQVWQMHRAAFHTLRDRQAAARSAEKAHQQIERKDISFARAKAELIRDADQLAANVPKARTGPWRQAHRPEPEAARAKDEDAFRRLAPKLPSGKAVPGNVPVAPQTHKQEAAKAALMREHRPPPTGIPTAPVRRPPEQKPPQREEQKAAKPFRDAVSSGTAGGKKELNDAVSPAPREKAGGAQARKERMRKDMERWKRRNARDDFDRER